MELSHLKNRPHDTFFKFVFSQKQLMEGFVRELMPDIAEHLDLGTLIIDNETYINEKLNKFYSDVVYNCQLKEGKSIKVALLLEHKSVPQSYPHLQLMEYLMGIWRKNVANKEPLTVVFPVIFYHGKSKWKHTTFQASFEELPNFAKPFTPSFDYYLIDLANFDDDFLLNLQTAFLLNALLAFKHKNDSEYARQHFSRIFHRLEMYLDTETGQQFGRYLSVYVVYTTDLHSEDVIELQSKLPPKTKNMVKTTYQNIFDEGVERGIERGIEHGIGQGKILTSVEFAINMLQLGLDDKLIQQSNPMINADLLKLLKDNLANNFQVLTFQKALAAYCISHFNFLNDDVVAQISKLDQATVLEIRNSML